MKTIRQKIFPETICLQHGIKGTLPCPWLNCPNGVKEDSFQVHPFFIGEDAQIYYRHQWKSPIKGIYYTWKNNLPHWFSSVNTLWNEGRRLGLVKEKIVEKIYHYTSLEAFVNIIEEKSIWLSDYSYLNDERELIHGVEIVSNVVNELLDSGQSQDVKGLLNAWLGATSNINTRVCVAAFSGDSDSLSQWRAYGPIAIGFDPKLLISHIQPASLGKVEYDPNLQRQLVEVFINHLIQSYQVDLENNAIDRIPDVYHEFEQVLGLVTFFKHNSFCDEREFRAAYIESPQFLKNEYLKPPTKRFRIKVNRLIPYVVSSELFFGLNEEPCELGICEVVLGPEADNLLACGIREFLDSKGFSEIPVIISGVPYRK